MPEARSVRPGHYTLKRPVNAFASRKLASGSYDLSKCAMRHAKAAHFYDLATTRSWLYFQSAQVYAASQRAQTTVTLLMETMSSQSPGEISRVQSWEQL